VLRDGECATHGSQEGDSDVRMRLVLDDGTSTISLIVNKSASESLIGMDQQKITSEISENGTMVFVQNLRERLLGRQLKASGRTIVDEQGAMLLSDEVELIELVPELIAAELRAKWGVV
jgi:replication factor A1